MSTKLFARTNWGQSYLVEWFKFRIANALDHIPSLCWAELATWAMNLAPWWSIFALVWPERRRFSDYSFAQDCRWTNMEQYPYCGKCWRNDRWLIGCTPEQCEQANAKFPKGARP